MKEIFAELYNKIVGFINSTELMQPKSKNVACNRLKLVLMQDRTTLSPHILERMRGEMIELLSKYLELDRELLDLNFEQEGESVALMLSIPVIRAKEEDEIEQILKEEDEAKKLLEELETEDTEEDETEEESEETDEEETDDEEAEDEEVDEDTEESDEETPDEASGESTPEEQNAEPVSEEVKKTKKKKSRKKSKKVNKEEDSQSEEQTEAVETQKA